MIYFYPKSNFYLDKSFFYLLIKKKKKKMGLFIDQKNVENIDSFDSLDENNKPK